MGWMQFRHIKKVMQFFVRQHLPAKSRTVGFYTKYFSISLYLYSVPSMCKHIGSCVESNGNNLYDRQKKSQDLEPRVFGTVGRAGVPISGVLGVNFRWE
jgi:hypothetical protein